MIEKNTIRFLHIFPTFTLAGSQSRFCDIANFFEDRYSHFIHAMDGNYEALARISPGVPVQTVNLDYLKSQTINNISKFIKVLKELKPDILFTYNWGAIEWVIANSLFQLCPVIHTEDGFNEDEIKAQKFRRILVRRLILARTSHVIVPSINLFNIAQTSWNINKTKLKYIPNGIDTQKFEILSKNRIQNNSNNITIGTVASIRKVKNISRLIRIFRNLPSIDNINLAIVGDGPDLAQLKEEALGCENINFLGYQKDPSKLISEMDLFILTSDSEQMPIAVVEAMAAGKSIVSTDVGDVKNMVSEANKPFIVPVHEEAKLGQALWQLITNRHLRLQIGKANQVKAKLEFDKGKMFASYEEIYNKVRLE